MLAVPWGTGEFLIAEQMRKCCFSAKVMVNEMGVYKKTTQTLGKLFPDYGMTDLYLSRWILFTKKTQQHAICFEINIKPVSENVMCSNHRMNSISWMKYKKKILNRRTLGETSPLFYHFEFTAAVSGRGILLLSLGFSIRFCFSAVPLPQTSEAFRTVTHPSPPRGSCSMRGTRVQGVHRAAAPWCQT